MERKWRPRPTKRSFRVTDSLFFYQKQVNSILFTLSSMDSVRKRIALFLRQRRSLSFRDVI